MKTAKDLAQALPGGRQWRYRRWRGDLALALFVAAFKIGGELTALYPVYATTFIWGAAIGVFLLGESLGPAKGLGMAFIVAGVLVTVR